MSTFKSSGGLTRHHAKTSIGGVAARSVLNQPSRTDSGVRFKPVGTYFMGVSTRFELKPSLQGGLIGGIVKDHTGAFAARRVNIHSQATGELLGSTVSNATTGEWEFVVDQMCYAVAFDNEISKRKAIVFDRIEPV